MKILNRNLKILLLISSGIILVALTLRLINLTILPVFADEAIYIRWAQVMRAEQTLRFLPLSDGKQPLFMWTVIPLLKFISDPLFAGRLVSVLSGMGTLVGIAVLSFLLFKSKKASLFASLFYAISPYAVFFDRLALVDSMLTMFIIWTTIFALLAIRYMRFDMAMLAGFALGGAALTKSPALFAALLLPTTLLFSNFPQKRKTLTLHLMKLFGLFLATYVIAFGMYNILRLGPEFHMIAIRNLDYVYPISHIFKIPLDPFLPYFDRALEWIRILGPEILVFFILFGAIRNSLLYKKQFIFLLLWAFIPILVQSEFAKVFTARYVYFTLPFMYILAGSALFNPVSGLEKKILYTVFAAFVIQALLVDGLLLTSPEMARLPRSERSGYLEEWTAGTGIKESADYIKAEHNRDPETPIVVGTEGYFGTLPDGLQIYLEKIPNVTVIGVGLGINQVPEQLSNSVKAGNKAYLVANSSRLNFNKPFEDSGLEVIKKYKKANRPDSTSDYLYLFRVNETDSIIQK